MSRDIIENYLTNETSLSEEDRKKFCAQIEQRWKLLQSLFGVFVTMLPDHQKDTAHLQLVETDDISPEARAFPGMLYRIRFPIKLLLEIECTFSAPEFSKLCEDLKNRIVNIALMLCLGHEMIHCSRGHLDEDVQHIKSEESDADFMAGGLVWGWSINQAPILRQHGFSPSNDIAYEVGFASAVLCALFQKLLVEGNDYHLPHQRMLSFLGGYANPISRASSSQNIIGICQTIERGVEDAREQLRHGSLSIVSETMFCDTRNRGDYEELIGPTQKALDANVPKWHSSSFLLSSILSQIKEK
jgi:hypothetical protein